MKVNHGTTSSKLKMLIFINARISEGFMLFILAPVDDFDRPSAQTFDLMPNHLIVYASKHVCTMLKL